MFVTRKTAEKQSYLERDLMRMEKQNESFSCTEERWARTSESELLSKYIWSTVYAIW